MKCNGLKFEIQIELITLINKLLRYLEVEANFKLMTGEATHGMKLVVAGAKVTKNSAYQDLAHYVNKRIVPQDYELL